MSLKAFHVVFVALATLFSVGFGVWAARAWAAGGGGEPLALAVTSFAIGVALVVYGAWFLRKMKGVSYL